MVGFLLPEKYLLFEKFQKILLVQILFEKFQKNSTCKNFKEKKKVFFSLSKLQREKILKLQYFSSS